MFVLLFQQQHQITHSHNNETVTMNYFRWFFDKVEKPKSNTPWQNGHAMLNNSSRAVHACNAVLSNLIETKEKLKKIKKTAQHLLSSESLPVPLLITRPK